MANLRAIVAFGHVLAVLIIVAIMSNYSELLYNVILLGYTNTGYTLIRCGSRKLGKMGTGFC